MFDCEVSAIANEFIKLDYAIRFYVCGLYNDDNTFPEE